MILPEMFNKDVGIQQLNYGITNFDNIYEAYLTLFQITMVEDWAKIMYMAYDSSGHLLPPIYFVLFLLICTYFLTNLAIAIFLKNWNILRK